MAHAIQSKITPTRPIRCVGKVVNHLLDPVSSKEMPIKHVFQPCCYGDLDLRIFAEVQNVSHRLPLGDFGSFRCFRVQLAEPEPERQVRVVLEVP